MFAFELVAEELEILGDLIGLARNHDDFVLGREEFHEKVEKI